MNDTLLLIFTRNPELGKCKTRLAKTIGDENALAVYKILLQHTVNTTKNLICDKAVYYSVQVRENDLWDATIYQKHQQYGEDLGERMRNAFKKGFEAGYQHVLIVGSDLYDLRAEHIEKAIGLLNTNDIVIGPALDGGYYLLGMKKLHEKVFTNKDWGTETVRKDTLSDLKNNKVSLLETLNDIDVFEDIKDYEVFKPYLTKT